MKQVEVQIMGQGYVLGCPEGGETHLQQAVQSVDQAMSKIRDAGKIKARDRIAVLAALNLAFDLADRPVATATTASSDPANDDNALQDLLHRLDAALGEDGQLL
jgi:cell division protein ZapA